MLINVSTLLQERPGSARDYTADEEPVSVPEAGFDNVVSGRVRLMRTERGVLVHARLHLEAPVACARCLTSFDQPLDVEFDEEYVLDRDPVTGHRIESSEDDFRIDEHRHLDLSEAVRQYGESALPLRPVCREGCLGLCPNCGQDWNEARCACHVEQTDHRWGALSGLAERLESEERHGGSEA